MTLEKDGPHVALVTGAAKRVGRAVALELARAGLDIAVHFNHSRSEAEAVVREIERLGGQGHLVQGDLRDRIVPDRLVGEAVERFGRLDVLVNNASVFKRMSLEEFGFDQWHDTMHINLAVPLRLCQLAVPIMRKQGAGCLINLTDAATDRPQKHYLAYGSSKAGLEYVTKALARELAPQIRVNGVAPGIAVFPEYYSQDLRKKLIDEVPLKKAGTPEDMAKTVRFLVESDYITGQIIEVDGGRSLV